MSRENQPTVVPQRRNSKSLFMKSPRNKAAVGFGGSRCAAAGAFFTDSVKLSLFAVRQQITQQQLSASRQYDDEPGL